MERNVPKNQSVLLLDEAFVSRPVNTHIFAPFLIARLEEHPDVKSRTLQYRITLQNVRAKGTQTAPLLLTWTEEVVPAMPLAAQPEYITEAAAYGMAFAILTHFTSAVLVDVADRGEHFDYVVSENGRLCGIEVSGTQTEERSVL